MTNVPEPSDGTVAGNLSVGYVVTAVDGDRTRWERLETFFQEVETAGADAIWSTDHLFSGHPSADAFVLATIAAMATDRCLVGTAVLQLPLRRSAVVAKAATTLQLVSGGRFRLGVGVGQHRSEYERADVDFTTRGMAADRALRDLAAHWTSTGAWFDMRPAVEVPIWIGGTSAPAFHRVARYGSGWIALFLDPGALAKANRRLDGELTDRGRDPESVTRRIVVLVSPTDRSWTRADALEWVARQFPNGTRGIERYLVTGSAEYCAEQLVAFGRAGADAVDLQVAHPDPVPGFAAIRSIIAASS